ncbi:hypothetical protein ACFL24_01460 [Patescibacteria group bacterium]
MPRTLKLILKIIPTLAVTFFAFMVIGEMLSEDMPELEPGTEWQGYAVGAICIIQVIAIIFLWWKEKIGKWFVTAAGLLMSILVFVTAGHNIILAGVLLGSPLYIPGLILILIKDKNGKKIS